jgi:hypothetical protein
MEMTLSPAQAKRYAKVFSEPFYLIDHTHDATRPHIVHTFKICGSTRSVYTVHLYQNGKLFCDCPDMRSNCAKSQCVCKHVCFVLVRVLKHTGAAFYETRALEPEQVVALSEKCARLNEVVDAAVTNDELANKFKNWQPFDFKCKKPVFDEDDECPICYLAFKPCDDAVTTSNQNKDVILGCPTCKNSVHEGCMIRWLQQTAKPSCVYCRSTAWERYGQAQPAYVQL